VDERFPQSKNGGRCPVNFGHWTRRDWGRLHSSLGETGCLLKRLHFCGRKLELLSYAVALVFVWFLVLCFWNRGGILGLNWIRFIIPLGIVFWLVESSLLDKMELDVRCNSVFLD
jgi:hypothetical protein